MFYVFEQAMVAFMENLLWNRVAVIHQDDVYGRQAAQTLKTLAEMKGICVPYITSVPIAGPFDQVLFRNIVQNLTSSYLQFFGIIVFSSGDASRTLLDIYQEEYQFSDSPVFIFSDIIELQTESFVRNDDILTFAKGSFQFSPPG